MSRLEDHYSPEEIQQMHEAMEQLRESRRASKKRARTAYAEMKRRDPEFWKAFGFNSEDEYLWYYDLRGLLNPDL
jgi:hypothetical protein